MAGAMFGSREERRGVGFWLIMALATLLILFGLPILGAESG